jgi:uncharacterized phage protein gp47/JayE
MPDYGVLPEGFRPQTIAEVREELEEELRQKFGRSFPLGDYTFAGHVVGTLAERLGLLWEVAELTYAAMDPDKASGDALRALGLLTGTFEDEPSASVVEAVLTGDDATVVPQGSLAANSVGRRFSLTELTTLVQANAWAASTAYELGDRVTNASRVYQCITAGVSAGAGGPIDSIDDETDGTVHWQYLGEGEAVADAVFACVDTGPVECVAGDLTSIETPVGGWSSVTNLVDAVLGRDVQTDESFRLKREAELHQPGTGPYEAVRAALLAVEGVTSVSILFNASDTTDVNGLPPHSFEALVRGGEDQDIRQAIWANSPLGIETYGSTSGTVLDSEGRLQTIRFSRPTEKLIHAKITLQKNPREYVGDESVKLEVATRGDLLGLGHDVFSSAVAAWSFVGGVLNVTEVLISVDPVNPPVSSATLVMGVRDMPLFDTSRVTVVSSDVTP